MTMERIARVHLDLVGGLAGDMFAAAMADAFPEHVPGLLAQLRKLPAPPQGSIEVVPFTDGVLSGRRFVVTPDGPYMPGHVHGEDGAHVQGHVAYPEIVARLRAAGLEPAVLEHALAILALLAQAEAAVHGVAVEAVEFHEVGAWDSIVDCVAAAWFIARVDAGRWTASPAPLGGGRVKTAHGLLPVPSPATVHLLRGMPVVDDGVGGERVTPTGAAILRHLANLSRAGDASRDGQGHGPHTASCAPPPAAPAIVAAAGHGFGSKRLAGIPNIVRCLAFAPAAALPQPLDEEIAVLQFEIDDQTAEDLAVALERIRAAEGVLEAYQLAAYGKKGRLATQVQVLARLESADRIADLCLTHTTTLGLRIARTWRRSLLRAGVTAAGAEAVRVKLASRPSGELTAKAEMDDIARAGGRREREALRRRAEGEALDLAKGHGTDRDD